jgi:hypothetical protein
MLYSKSASGVYDRNITLLLLCYGAVAAKAANRLVIAYMSKSPLELWDWVYLSPFVMILNQYYDFHFNEYYLLLASTVSPSPIPPPNQSNRPTRFRYTPTQALSSSAG